ncbi:MAG: hypothetical protein CL933_02090 [Deltaproteobacteria bacterium]|nr:hypothetical protein [Deltaproteobacteria bacterium]
MTAHSVIDALLSEIVRINPLQSNFLKSSLDDITPEELDDLGEYLQFCDRKSLDVAYLAECYDIIVRDTLREQMFFQRHKRYRYSTFAEVADAVYFDDAYMRKYMHGLAITAWLWPNHREMHRYFANSIPTDREGRYLEIGPGHGVYMSTAMNRSRYGFFEGVDLSPTSVEMTTALLQSRDVPDDVRYEIYCCDMLEGDLRHDRYDAIVMGEVLEHVEEPLLFLERIGRLAADDAFIFVTTPINAPAIDHIQLFRSPEVLENLVARAGLSVRESRLIPYPGQTTEESLEQRLPINVALVLGQ